MFIAISQKEIMQDHRKGDSLEQVYTDYFNQFKINFVPIPNRSKDINAYFNRIPFNGVILSGGNDISPASYNELSTYSKNCSNERDKTEKAIINQAIKRKLPILGICRGMQMINVYFSGTLIQSLEKELNINHIAQTHQIDIIEMALYNLIKRSTATVNSYHSQGLVINGLAQDLKAFALSKDGIVEGLYHKILPIAGVQWHPGRDSSDKELDKILTKAFLGRQLFWGKK